MTFVSGVIASLEANWNGLVTSAPNFLDGARETSPRRKRKKYKNVIFVYDLTANFELIEPTHTYKDGTYRGRLDIVTTQSEAKRDNMVSEANRIMGQTGVTDYENRKVVSIQNLGDTSKWFSRIFIQMTKYSETIL